MAVLPLPVDGGSQCQPRHGVKSQRAIETLDLWRSSRFGWGNVGGLDCMLGTADHIARVRGFDIFAQYRGAYRDEGGARAILNSEGGHLLLLDRALSQFGVPRTQSPAPGDPVLVELGDEQHAGIRVPHGFVFLLAGRGVVEGRFSRFVVAAWSL